jgi:hypothetical protein
MADIAGPTLCFGGITMLLMLAVLGGLVWLYRLGWGKTDDDEPDQPAEIVIEIPEAGR